MLCKKLKELGTIKDVCIIVTNDSLNGVLRACFDNVINLSSVSSPSPEKLRSLGRQELLTAMTKVELWNQTEYDRIVYLDCDCLPLSNLDDLFDFEMGSSSVAASPDCGWPDIFNSGVMVLKPDSRLHAELMKASQDPGLSFDGADQGLLNQKFPYPQWVRLPFLYNVTPSAGYQYVPALQHFGADVKNFHFIGPHKPWDTINSSEYASFFAQSAFALDYLESVHRKWWECFNRECGRNAGGRTYVKSRTENCVQDETKGEAWKVEFKKVENQWETLQTGDNKATLSTFWLDSESMWEDKKSCGQGRERCSRLMGKNAVKECVSPNMQQDSTTETHSFVFPWESYRPAPQRLFPPLSPVTQRFHRGLNENTQTRNFVFSAD